MTKPIMRAARPVLLTEGEYSDYGHIGVFVALQDITAGMLNEARAAALPQGDDQSRWDTRARFMAELIRRGWVMDVNVETVHIGDYGEVEPFYEPD